MVLKSATASLITPLHPQSIYCQYAIEKIISKINETTLRPTQSHVHFSSQ